MGIYESPNTEHFLALPRGTMLFEYRIDSVLGQGGFGITYLAHDTLLEEAVAIKEYFPNEHAVRTPDLSARAKSTEDQEAFRGGLDAFLDEARIIARFRHPNIMQVRRFFEAHGTGYIVLQFERGRSLEEVIAGAPLPEPEILPILSGILAGLSVVHEQAILHRDLKPRNVIVRHDGSPVLIDFGAARDFRIRNSRSVTKIASPGYSPPEQYGVGNQQGPWTDFYALGAILYRAVTGKVPVDSLRRLRDDPLVPAARAAAGRYSTGLLRAIDAMLHMEEHKRPATASEILKVVPAIAPASSAVRTEKRQPSQALGQGVSHVWDEGNPARPASRRPMLWICLGVLALLVAGLGSFFVFNRSSPPPAPPEVAKLDPAGTLLPAEPPKASPPPVQEPKRAAGDMVVPVAPPETAGAAAPPAEAPRKAADDRAALPAAPQAPSAGAPAVTAAKPMTGDTIDQNPPAAAAPAGLPAPPQAAPAAPPAPVAATAPAPPLGAARPSALTQAAPSAEPASQQAGRTPGAVFRDCSNCPELVVLPAGSFEMGANDIAFARPPHPVQVPKPFAMGRFAVTFEEWDGCVSGGGCKSQPNDHGWGRGQRPVIDVSWVDASAYVAWLSKTTGHRYRLPSEAEWEYAGRAGTATAFWWGNDVGTGHANCSNCAKEPARMTQPVGSYSPNAFGLFDMAGNVAEWVEDCWTPSYAGAPRDGSADRTGDCGKHVLRGGSFRTDAGYLRSAFRFYYGTAVPYYTNGFRVARELP